ncbi:MAG TPA: hypothetical protein VFA94_11095 [Acidimicrobiales bacterium]|nr:hypothetical protein [Acidimicrobiales bacterium]
MNLERLTQLAHLKHLQTSPRALAVVTGALVLTTGALLLARATEDGSRRTPGVGVQAATTSSTGTSTTIELPHLDAAAPTSTTTTTPAASSTTAAPASTTVKPAATTTTAPPIAYPTGEPDPVTMGGLYMIGLDGAPHRIFTSTSLLDLPAWSVDGRRILGQDSSTVFTVAPDGSGSRAVPGGGISTPAWSRTGQLAWVDFSSASTYDLFVSQPTGAPKRISQAQVGPVSGRTWAPDGKHLSLVAGGRVWTAAADTTGLKAVTPAGKAWRWVAYSPDGTKLAWYVGDDSANGGQVWVAATDGSGAHQVATTTESFAWSPDSSTLVVNGNQSTGFGLAVVPAAGGPARPLGVAGGDMTWSPDGRRIAYLSVAKPIRLGLVNADGTGATTLFQAPDNVVFGRGLAWSPDGTHLLANTGGGGEGGPPPPS